MATSLGHGENERMGTIPFMTLDLHMEHALHVHLKYLYRHDLESFIWVLVWVCLRCKDGILRSSGSRTLGECARIDAVQCGNKKVCSFIRYIFRLWKSK
ncbi:hypothetical protein DFH29DRAFT_893449 [Suillus ampliporus]|nr:hypothetical protein DFH29DRAFT_893449 [Suillus ampliporus]